MSKTQRDVASKQSSSPPMSLLKRIPSLLGLLLPLLLLFGCTLLWEWLRPLPPGFELISDAEGQTILDVFTDGAAMVDDYMALGDPQAVKDMVDWFLLQPGVASCQMEQDGTIWVEFDCGLSGSIVPYSLGRESPAANASALRIHSPVSDRRDVRRPRTTSHASGMLSDKAVILLPFLLEEVTKCGTIARDLLEGMGFADSCIDEYTGTAVSLEVMRSLDEYAVVYMITHGACSSTNQWIVLGEKPHGSGLAELWNWYKSKTVIGITWCEGTLRYEISDLFIGVEDLHFPDSLVIMNACNSRKRTWLSNAFLSAGASVFFAWTSITDTNLVQYTSRALLTQLGMPHTSVASAYERPALQLGWDRRYSIDETFPATLLEDSDQDDLVLYRFANDLAFGDMDDASASEQFTTDFVYAGDSQLVVSRLFWAESSNRLFAIGIDAQGTDSQQGLIVDSQGGLIDVTDIAWEGGSETLYGVSFDTLYEIDTDTCQATAASNQLYTDSDVNALAADGSGALYAVSTSGVLLEVSKSTGIATPVGPLGGNLESSGDIAFAPDGTLFGTVKAFGEIDDLLVRISVSTGTATRVGSTGYQDVFGLFFVGEELYGATATNKLIKINTQTGEAMFVRDLSFSAWGAQDAGN